MKSKSRKAKAVLLALCLGAVVQARADIGSAPVVEVGSRPEVDVGSAPVVEVQSRPEVNVGSYDPNRASDSSSENQPPLPEPISPKGAHRHAKVSAISCRNMNCYATKWFQGDTDDRDFMIRTVEGGGVFTMGYDDKHMSLTVLDARGGIAFRDGFSVMCEAYHNTCSGSAQLKVESFPDGRYSFQIVQLDNNRVLAGGGFSIQTVGAPPSGQTGQKGRPGKALLTPAQIQAYRNMGCLAQAAGNPDVKCVPSYGY